MEAPCPRNYNPADYYVQLLAIIPGKEESCRQAVTMICDTFEKSELGVRVAVEAASVINNTNTIQILHFFNCFIFRTTSMLVIASIGTMVTTTKAHTKHPGVHNFGPFCGAHG